jgi:hypothetical protein
MRSLPRYALLAVTACAVLAVSAPAAAQAAVFLPNCGSSTYGGRVQPSRWDAGCTGQWELIRAKWSLWGRGVAIGKGFTQGSDCDPDCASGTLYEYRSRLRVSRIRTCKGKSGAYRRFYTRARLRFRVPSGDDSGIREGVHTVRFPLRCVR